MSEPVLDLQFLYELAENDPYYIFHVLKLFVETVPDGLANLERSVRTTNDFDTIFKQAHFLKSSAGIVKVRGMYNDLEKIELLARQGAGINEITDRLEHILVNFKEALPKILAEIKKVKSPKEKDRKID